MLAFIGTVTENRAPPRRIAPITAAGLVKSSV
jgi:hypothetical protein